MNLKKKSKNDQKLTRDAQKEAVYRQLSSLIEDAGYQVRREELKRGNGWKVVSGACRVEASKLILLDRRMTQDDQIAFLVGTLQSLGATLDSEKIAQLPQVIQHQLTKELNEKAA